MICSNGASKPNLLFIAVSILFTVYFQFRVLQFTRSQTLSHILKEILSLSRTVSNMSRHASFFTIEKPRTRKQQIVTLQPQEKNKTCVSYSNVISQTMSLKKSMLLSELNKSLTLRKTDIWYY